jgi:uncharacterized membrane protein
VVPAQLAVPSLAAPLLPALRELWPEMLGYFMSFAFRGGIWISHSRLTRPMIRGDSVAYGLNLLMLLFVCLLPFTTRVMVTHVYGPDISSAVIIYGLNVLCASFALNLLMFYVARQRHLVVDDVSDEVVKGMYRRRWSVLGLCTFGVIVAFVAPLAGVILYLVTAVVFLLLPLIGSPGARPRATAVSAPGKPPNNRSLCAGTRSERKPAAETCCFSTLNYN